MRSVEEDGWVPVAVYEDAVAFSRRRKEKALEGAQSAEERDEIVVHWPWRDMDEVYV